MPLGTRRVLTQVNVFIYVSLCQKSGWWPPCKNWENSRSPGKAINYSVCRARQLNPQFLAGPGYTAWARWPQESLSRGGGAATWHTTCAGSTGRFKYTFIQTLEQPLWQLSAEEETQEAENPQRVVVGLG